MRRTTYASCGLQKGYAAIGERWVYSLILPGVTSHPSLVSSWYGDRRPHGVDEAIERFYDRVANPFPGLAEELAFKPLLGGKIREDAGEYFKNIDLARRAYQLETLFNDPITAEEMERLRRDGFLGDGP